jgi:hypothetical protein
MHLDTVGDYIVDARRLLQDRVAPYRYPDEDLVAALNSGILEARRLRPDLSLNANRTNTYPLYTFLTPTDPVAFDPQFRVALVYYIVGRCALSDEENNEDQRATVFMNKFTSQLLTVAS